MSLLRPSLGFGLGLRVDHYEAILADRPPVDHPMAWVADPLEPWADAAP